MSEPIRWGVLGAGGIAATVAADIAAVPGTLVQAVAARDADRAAAFAARHGIPRSYGSYAELVADPDVDVVHVATTNAQHRDHALLCLQAGKPVLVEKAFTLNAAQAREVVAAARERGLFCMEAMWMRLHPLIRRARDLVDEGRIGQVTGVRTDLCRPFDYDPAHRLFDLGAGGGALLDLGVYAVTAAWLLLGAPDTVHATGALAPTGADVTAALQWGYADGRVGQVFTSSRNASPFAALVTGTGGWISVEPRIHRATRLVIGSGDGPPEVIEREPDPGNGYRREIEEVVRCLRAGETESPLVPLNETIAILDLLDEARRQLGVRYPADG